MEFMSFHGIDMLGRIEITPEATRSFSEEEIHRILALHATGDYGEVSYEEYSANLYARYRSCGTLLVSRHRSSKKELAIIITSSDGFETVTTVCAGW